MHDGRVEDVALAVPNDPHIAFRQPDVTYRGERAPTLAAYIVVAHIARAGRGLLVFGGGQAVTGDDRRGEVPPVPVRVRLAEPVLPGRPDVQPDLVRRACVEHELGEIGRA